MVGVLSVVGLVVPAGLAGLSPDPVAGVEPPVHAPV